MYKIEGSFVLLAFWCPEHSLFLKAKVRDSGGSRRLRTEHFACLAWARAGSGFPALSNPSASLTVLMNGESAWKLPSEFNPMHFGNLNASAHVCVAPLGLSHDDERDPFQTVRRERRVWDG